MTDRTSMDRDGARPVSDDGLAGYEAVLDDDGSDTGYRRELATGEVVTLDELFDTKILRTALEDNNCLSEILHLADREGSDHLVDLANALGCDSTNEIADRILAALRSQPLAVDEAVVKRVARAIHDTDWPLDKHIKWGDPDQPPDMRERYLSLARAAIAALNGGKP